MLRMTTAPSTTTLAHGMYLKPLGSVLIIATGLWKAA